MRYMDFVASNAEEEYAVLVGRMEAFAVFVNESPYSIERELCAKKLEDVNNWQNPRLRLSPKAIQGKMLCKILYAMQQRHGCQFLFCKKAETGAKIMEILGGGEIGV